MDGGRGGHDSGLGEEEEEGRNECSMWDCMIGL
jgi:hypothetical protein